MVGLSLHSQSPQVGFEPTTNRLTADRSTTELLRNVKYKYYFTELLYTFASLSRPNWPTQIV